MEHSLSDALSVLAVGMITVFFILTLVVVVGNLIVRITNKFWSEPEKENGGSAGLSPNKLAAIIAAVAAVTKGKGKVTNINKL